MGLISEQKKICFTHIIKTGGTFVRKELEKNFNDLKIINHIHSSLKDDLVSNNYIKDYKKASIVRNPYDWIISLYYYIKMPINHPDFRIVNNLTLYDFVKWISEEGFKRKKNTNNSFYSTQSYYLYSEDGKLLVDQVFKYEELSSNNVFKYLGITKQVSNNIINPSKRPKEWDKLYDKRTIELINNVFNEDFVNFNYKKL